MNIDDKELDEARHAIAQTSVDDPDWLQKSRALASLLLKRFETTGQGIFLAECIGIQRRICAVCTTGNPDRAVSISDLAFALRAHFKQTGEQSLLTEAISLNREALSLRSTGHPDRSVSCSNLASSLWSCFLETGEQSHLTEAIDLGREALSLRPRGHPDRSISCNSLAVSLCIRFEETGQESILAEVISLHREALALRTKGHPGRVWSCSNLGNSLRMSFNRTGEASLLTEAIGYQREALSLQPQHPDRPALCSNLALSLWTLFNHTGEESLLAEAIGLEREALSLLSRGHPLRSKVCNNLANSLRARFNQSGEESLLEEAINLQREALSLQPKEYPLRSITCSNLADSLRKLFIQRGEESLLVEVIDLNREALLLRPRGHPDRSVSCTNLALSFLTLFEQTGEESLLNEVIDLNREALSLRPKGHPDRSRSCNNLANLLLTRCKKTGEESLLAEAIDLHREALSLRTNGHPDRSLSCTNLAASLWECFKSSGEESLLVEAIDLHREALSLHASGHPDRLEMCNRLAASLKTWFNLTADESLLVEAIGACMETMEAQPQYHPSRWKPLTNLVAIYLDRRFSQHNPVLAVDYLHRALSIPSHEWPTLLSEVAQLTSCVDLPSLPQDSLSRLLQCFSAAIDIASRVAGFILDPESQLKYLNSSQHLGPRAYWCALVSGRPQLGLELMEHARAMIWTQALHMRSSQFSGAPPELALELEVLLSRMNTLRVPETPNGLTSFEQDTRHKNGVRIYQLIKQIRDIPGQERFMRGLSFKELAQCANRNPVVMLVATEGRCYVTILRTHDQVPLTIELSDIKPHELKEMSSIASATQMRGSTSEKVEDHRMGMKAKVPESYSNTRSNHVLQKLWTAVVKPVINYLGIQKSSGSSRPRLHWCPTGAFMSLPLHAAGVYGVGNTECCSDYVVSSYTPSLTTLLRAQRSNHRIHKSQAKLGLLAVMQAWDINFAPLLHVEDEIKYVQAAAKKANISVGESSSCVGDVTTVRRVSEVFENTNIVHIACHGTQNTADPLSSGFCLSDASLSVSRLMGLDLKDAFIAFLSACETAKGDEKQPDQTVHLAAAMLFVGFRSVVATMWAMNDSDGPLIAELFYERLFSEDFITLDAVPYALDYAVSELRECGVPPERWATFIHMGA